MVGRFQGFYTKTAMTTCTMHQYANEVCLQLDYLLSHLAVVEAIVAVGVVITRDGKPPPMFRWHT